MTLGLPQTSHAGWLTLKLEKVSECVEQGTLSALTLINMSSRKQLFVTPTNVTHDDATLSMLAKEGYKGVIIDLKLTRDSSPLQEDKLISLTGGMAKIEPTILYLIFGGKTDYYYEAKINSEHYLILYSSFSKQPRTVCPELFLDS